MPVGVAHEVIDHEPVVRGVAHGALVSSAAGGGMDPLVMRIESIGGFDGLEHLPGGDQLLMAGEHILARADQTVAAARQRIRDGGNAQPRAELRGDDLVHRLLASATRLDEQPPTGVLVDRPAFGKIAAVDTSGALRLMSCDEEYEVSRISPSASSKGLSKKLTSFHSTGSSSRLTPVLIRQAQSVGPVEQFAGR